MQNSVNCNKTKTMTKYEYKTFLFVFPLKRQEKHSRIFQVDLEKWLNGQNAYCSPENTSLGSSNHVD